MRILVCGGRDFGHVVRSCGNPAHEPPETQERLKEYQFIQDVLNEITCRESSMFNPQTNWLPTDITIIAGGARGADSAAADFATVNFCKLEEYPADWNLYGKRAGYIRNKQMLVEGKPDLVVAFPGGKGTAMMVDIATKAGVRVINMGTLGQSSQTEKAPEIKTKKYMQMYIDRIQRFKLLTPGQKAGIYMEVLKEEETWLKNMGSEYDEIIAAQDALDGVNQTSNGEPDGPDDAV